MNGMARRLESYIEKYTGDGEVATYRESRSDIFPWSQCNARLRVLHRSVSVTRVRFLMCWMSCFPATFCLSQWNPVFSAYIWRAVSCWLSPNIIYIKIFSHHQHTICEQFYWFASSFDPELGSSSGHDTRIWMYIETKYSNLRQWQTWCTLALFYNIFIAFLYMFRALYAASIQFNLLMMSI